MTGLYSHGESISAGTWELCRLTAMNYIIASFVAFSRNNVHIRFASCYDRKAVVGTPSGVINVMALQIP